jgi:hypothetical protein
MTCINASGIRRIAVRQVHMKLADIPVTPSLQRGQKVFARQIACNQTIESEGVVVGVVEELGGPTIEDDDHLHVTDVVPGVRVEVYRNGSFFKDGRSASSNVRILLATPLPAGDIVKARQILCGRVSIFGPALTIRDNVDKRRLEVVPVEVANSPKLPAFPDFATERICQLTGSGDPEGIPILNNCAAAGITGADLGIVVDHDTGDGRLYFFFGDTWVTEDVEDDFPFNADCMARTGAWEVGQFGPKLEFLPRPCNIPGVVQTAASENNGYSSTKAWTCRASMPHSAILDIRTLRSLTTLLVLSFALRSSNALSCSAGQMRWPP